MIGNTGKCHAPNHFGAPKTSTVAYSYLHPSSGRAIAGQCTVKKSRGSRPSSGLARAAVWIKTRPKEIYKEYLQHSLESSVLSRLKMHHKEVYEEVHERKYWIWKCDWSMPFCSPSDTLQLFLLLSASIETDWQGTCPQDLAIAQTQSDKGKNFFSSS